MIVDELKDTLYVRDNIICRKSDAPLLTENKATELLHILRTNEKDKELDITKDCLFDFVVYKREKKEKCICSTRISELCYIQNKKSGNIYQVGCVCVEKKFDKLLKEEIKNKRNEYTKMKKELEKEINTLEKIELNRNNEEIHYNDEIKKIEKYEKDIEEAIEDAKNKIINRMNKFIIFTRKGTTIEEFIRTSGIEKVRNYLIENQWNIKDGELFNFIYESESKSIKEFVNNELLDSIYIHPKCAKCNKDRKNKRLFEDRYRYTCCKDVYPVYGFYMLDNKPVLQHYQHLIEQSKLNRKSVSSRFFLQTQRIDSEIKIHKNRIIDLEEKLKVYT